MVSLLNLNNEVFGFYQGSKQYQIQRESTDRTTSVGVRITRSTDMRRGGARRRGVGT